MLAPSERGTKLQAPVMTMKTRVKAMSTASGDTVISR